MFLEFAKGDIKKQTHSGSPQNCAFAALEASLGEDKYSFIFRYLWFPTLSKEGVPLTISIIDRFFHIIHFI